jgi:Putative zinc-finger
MTMSEKDCTRDGVELAPLYLAGKLTESEAERFEAHYLGCASCAAALREAGEIRAALGRPVLVPRVEVSRASYREVATLLAAAATVAMLFFGLRQLAERQAAVSDSVVYRSASADRVALTVTNESSGQLVLAWTSHPDAQSYRLEIVRSDGVPVLETETPGREMVVAIDDLPPRPADVQLLARIEALNGLHEVVARSERTLLPTQ